MIQVLLLKPATWLRICGLSPGHSTLSAAFLLWLEIKNTLCDVWSSNFPFANLYWHLHPKILSCTLYTLIDSRFLESNLWDCTPKLWTIGDIHTYLQMGRISAFLLQHEIGNIFTNTETPSLANRARWDIQSQNNVPPTCIPMWNLILRLICFLQLFDLGASSAEKRHL